MKLRMRLILSYTVLALTAAAVLGGISYYYLNQQYRASAYRSAEFTARQVLSNYDKMQNMMEQAGEAILSSPDALSSIRDLSRLMSDKSRNPMEISDAQAVVRRTVGTNYNMYNFYRVIVFNRFGYIASSAHMGIRLADEKKDIKELKWLSSVEGTKGKFILLPPHEDDWSAREKKESVYSAVKEIQGNKLGFIEVQITASKLGEILAAPVGKALAVGPDGKILYAADGLTPSDYSTYFDGSDGVFETDREFIAAVSSSFSGIRILLIQNRKALSQGMPNSVPVIWGIVGTFLLFSICFIVVMANFLTKPIRELRGKMERTQLSNLSEDISISSRDADIQALTAAYRDLLGRLQNAIEREKKLTLLQLQAQFDALQAQVNPHFLYNILNLISNRGMQDNDEAICRICSSLASMFRYSSSNVERYATLRQEMEYLSHYVFLLEARFEKRLEVRVEMDDTILEESVPKIVLQQLVENSIEHGYANSPGKMEIIVRGYREKTGWLVEVLDNGEGIAEETRATLIERMQTLRTQLKDSGEIGGMEIGGMGLINTYGRMYLLYGEKVVFDLRNRTDAPGAVAILGVKGS